MFASSKDAVEHGPLLYSANKNKKAEEKRGFGVEFPPGRKVWKGYKNLPGSGIRIVAARLGIGDYFSYRFRINIVIENDTSCCGDRVV